MGLRPEIPLLMHSELHPPEPVSDLVATQHLKSTSLVGDSLSCYQRSFEYSANERDPTCISVDVVCMT
jgi:hypothetical protein